MPRLTRVPVPCNAAAQARRAWAAGGGRTRSRQSISPIRVKNPYTVPVSQLDDLKALLADSPVFRDLPSERLDEIVPLFRIQDYPAGSIILHQGDPSAAVYFLLSGRLAVRVRRGQTRETVAWIQPPELFGELSVITGRPCVADVEVKVDAEVAVLTRASFPSDPAVQSVILRGLARIIAERLQVSVTGGGQAPAAPVILLQPEPGWEASRSFPIQLALAIGFETNAPTLLVDIGPNVREEVRETSGPVATAGIAAEIEDVSLRGRVAAAMTHWASRFPNIILNPVGDAAAFARAAGEFTNCHGYLLGPNGVPPPEQEGRQFVLQSAVAPTLPVLDGNHQLLWDADISENNYLSGSPVTPRFHRTVNSIARYIAGTQVGLALGGGAAWGWAHIGVLDALEGAAFPVDIITGCSMGSVIGGLRASGNTVAELTAIADYWRTRKLRFIEWRVWRFCLLNERVVRRVFEGYFGQRKLNQLEIPFWANAVDLQTGKEFTLNNQPMVDALRGSIGLPGLLPPLEYPPGVGEHLLVDAGIMDPVPVRVARKMGARFTIAVNAMVPPNAQKPRTRYPLNMIDILTRCMFIMGHEIGQAAAENAADVVFTPELRQVSMLDFGRSPEIIESGRIAAMKHLPAIQALYERMKTTVATHQTVGRA